MSLCDPLSVLERVNKNIIAETMENLDRKHEPIPIDYVHYWKKFIFDEYFPFIFELAETSFFTNISVYKKNVVSFKRFTSTSIIEEAIKKKKILVSLYKAPEWFAKSYHQLNDEEKRDSTLSDYLYICYNPLEDYGKKVTVSMHIMKKPEEVLNAELDYKTPFTKRTVIGLFSTLASLAASIGNYANIGIDYKQFLTIGPILFIVGAAFIFFDARQLVNNVHNGSLNKLVTKHKKTMKKRLDSSHSLIFLESFRKRIDTSIASAVVNIVQNSSEKIYVNEVSLLKEIQYKLGSSITGFELSQVINILLERNLLMVDQNMQLILTLQENEYKNKRYFDKSLLENFNLPYDLETKLYNLYKNFRTIVLEICEIAHLNPPMLPEC